MNWAFFIIVAWFSLGLELGLRDALGLGSSGIAPSFAIALLVFVAMHAPRHIALWTGLALGLALDLTRAGVSAGETGVSTIAVIGPGALGCLLAAQLIVTVRAMMMRRSPLAAAAMGFSAAAIANLVIAGVLTARSWYDPAIEVSATAEMTSRLASAVYTGVLTPIVVLALAPLTPFFGFAPGAVRAS